jgi:hypothetical protein
MPSENIGKIPGYDQTVTTVRSARRANTVKQIVSAGVISNTETITTAPYFGYNSPLSLDSPQIEVTAVASANRQYIAQGYAGGILPLLRSLSASGTDDLTCQFGVDVYDRMSRDGEVDVGLLIPAWAVSTHPNKWVASVKPTDPNFGKAQYLADFMNYVTERLPISLNKLMYAAMYNARKFGSHVWEYEWSLIDGGQYAGAEIITNAVPKCIKSYHYIVDQFGKLVFVAPRHTFGGTEAYVGSLMPVDHAQHSLHGALPRDKIGLFTWGWDCQDVRGVSALMRAYQPWWAKQRIMEEYVSWMARFAQPSLVIELADGAQERCEKLPDGTIIRINPINEAKKALADFRNGSVLAIPHGAKVYMIKPDSAGDTFIEGVKLMNNEISRSFWGQHLATNEGSSRSGSDSRTHQDVFALAMEHAINWMAEGVRDEFARPIIRRSLGAEYYDCAHLVPTLDVGSANGMRLQVGDIAALLQSNYFTYAQLAGIDQRLGLPVRERNDAAFGPRAGTE